MYNGTSGRESTIRLGLCAHQTETWRSKATLGVPDRRMYRADRFSVIGAVAYSPETEPASDHAVRSPDSEMRHCAEQPRTTTSETALSVPRSITAPVAQPPHTHALLTS